MYATLRRAPAIALTMVILGSAAEAQTPEEELGRRWSVSWTLGAAFGNSNADIEEAMVAAGLDDGSPGCFFGPCAPIPHPWSYEGSWQSTITLSYAVRPRLLLRALWGRADLGATHGYRDGAGFGNFMFLQQTVTTLAVLPALKLGGAFRVAAGPSLNFVKISDTAASGSGRRSSNAAKPGFVVDAGLSTPARSRFFFEITGQYRYALPAEIGPFERPESQYSEAVTLPRTRVSMSHAVLGLGVGVRF